MDAFAGAIMGLAIGLGFALSYNWASGTARRLERKLDLLIRHAGIDLTQAATDEVVSLARAGKKIEAIKAYRDLTGCGLAEAKQKVEAMA